ncbi:MAG: SAM-dependent methyltransferase [Clostridia bacterium]|nr:SAM-dependent methyltransferase [Clostridia bacterium]
MVTNRIKLIASFVNKDVVAEIGADHGYITKYLFDTKKIKYAVLTDISSKSLQKAKDNFNILSYCNKVCFCVGDGLTALNALTDIDISDISQIIIAGMGAKEIISILQQNKIYKNFVLQPQKNAIDLRIFLTKNGYRIKKDVMVKDGKIFYNVLHVVSNTSKPQKLTKRQLMFGLTNLKRPNKYFYEYLNFKKDQYMQILTNANSKEIKIKYNLIKKELDRLANFSID